MSYRYNISSSLEKRFSISYNLFIAVSVIYFFRYFMKTHRAGFVRKEQKVHLMIMAVLVTLVFFANFGISALPDVFFLRMSDVHRISSCRSRGGCRFLPPTYIRITYYFRNILCK